MATRALSLVSILAFSACNGGGASFTPSADIMATHPHLRGNWRGANLHTVSFTLTEHDRLDSFRAFVSIGGLGAATGEAQADGDQLRVNVWTPGWGQFSFTGTLRDDDATAFGPWSISGGSYGYRGESVRMEQWNRLPVVTIDTIDDPDLLLVVRREWR